MLTRTRKLLFAGAAIVLSVAATGGALVAAELYARGHLARSDGLNVQGYRGRLLGRKQPGEVRIAMVGGSTAFGFGVLPEQSPPAYLEEKLAQWRRQTGQGPVSVANLAYTGDGAFAAQFTLADYAYLEPDVVVFYDGYNDVVAVNHQVFRHSNPIFRVTGYFPILPLVIHEKALLLRYGSLEAAYGGKKIVFRPTVVQRTTATVLSATEKMGQSVGNRLEQLLGPDKPATEVIARDHPTMCSEQWTLFCQMVAGNIDYALVHGMRVLVIGQPVWANPKYGQPHREQQGEMLAMVQAQYGSNPAVRQIDLRDAIDLEDTSLAIDRMHLTPVGNERLASFLVDPLMGMLTDLAREGR